MTIYRVDQVWQLAGVYEIRKKILVAGKKVPAELEFDEEYGRNYSYLLIQERGDPIATARINFEFESENYGKIERVAVIPDHQKSGYGRKLIEAGENWIIERGLKKIVITSQEQAVGFYEKLGYTIYPEIKLKSKIPIVYTEKIVES